MERPELATEVAERKGESVRRERDEKGRVREREREREVENYVLTVRRWQGQRGGQE